MSEKRFRLNSPPVVAETIGGEATIVDLDNGTYYALNESGSFVWDALLAGTEVGEVAASVVEHYDVDREQAERDVETLVAELRERELIAPLKGSSPSGANGSRPVPAPNGGYSKPELSVYTDMQELLLLDPVHEVDDAGWPARP